MKSNLNYILSFIILSSLINTLVNTNNKNFDKALEQKAFITGIKAYFYGYPLVLMQKTKEIMTAGISNKKLGRINSFVSNFTPLNPKFNLVVSPNDDTLYTSAWLDLSKTPIILHIPKITGRYYLMELLDAWTNVFGSISPRTHENKAKDFLIVGPNFANKLPENIKNVNIIKAPTNMVWIIGRTQFFGPQDYKAANKIQKQYKLITLDNIKRSLYSSTTNQAFDINKVNLKSPIVSPVKQVEKMDAQSFFSMLSKLMCENPAPPIDKPMLKTLKSIGILPCKEFNINKLNINISIGLRRSIQAAQKMININFKNLVKTINNWQISTSDKIGNYKTDYYLRALIAKSVLGANLPQDSVYLYTTIDKDNKQLTGANKYKLHVKGDQKFPANAFWSITLYNQDHFFVPNIINRYAIHSYDKIKHNPDGSFDILIQRDKPKQGVSNWLPAPKDNFNLIIRLYWPKVSVFKDKWIPPTIKRI